MLDHISLIIIVVSSILFYFLGRRSAHILPPAPPSENVIIVDTSALIDGRISEVAKTGFLVGHFIVFSFILSELQNIADSSDPLRRAKGRRGLKILKDLQKIPSIHIKIVEEKIDNVSNIDSELVRMAKEKKAKILTTDYNLNEVAKIQDVQILNINELSNAIKPVLLPGEVTDVKIVQKGKEEGQGVGYLEDGTMIVVEEGQKYIGKKLHCEVSRIFQTEAGRMIFVKPIESDKKRFSTSNISQIFKRPQFFSRNDKPNYKNNKNYRKK